MRHKKISQHSFTDTARKRAALRRKQRLEREALPLLADLIAEAQPGEDAVMQDRAIRWTESQQRTRDLRAARWREARRRLGALTANERSILRHAWDCAPYPADPVYLLDFLHDYNDGRFALDAIPFDLVARNEHGHRLVKPAHARGDHDHA